MTDTLSPSDRSHRMSLIRSTDSAAEIVVRKLIHRMGYRFRLHRKDLPGTPDLVFPKLKKVVFVHGCFWHRHPDPECSLARLPKSRLDFWVPKLTRNRDRDERNTRALVEAGWQAIVVWECQLSNLERVESTLKAFLGERV
ncbi:MAG: very short patch repair endonuclease [Acidobacteriota bacterium]